MNEFLLSIIIPTKNRQKYLLKCVEEILQFKDERLQIVIQDNSDIPDIANSLPACSVENKIKYRYSPGTISFVENFSLAVDAADGLYACMIGDDDGITKFIGDVTEWAKEHCISAIKPDILFEYFWPNSIKLKDKHYNGVVRLLDSKIRVKRFNPQKHLSKLLFRGGQDYTSLDVGKLYHGIIETQKLRDIKRITGKYFGGLSPDIYMAVALSLILDEAVKISFPLTIAGVCQTSGSADSSNGRHVGPLNSAPHFKGHDNYKWSKEVPKFYSVETIWADSILAALYDFKRYDLIEKFSISNLDACCSMLYPEYRDTIMMHFKEYQSRCLIIKKLKNYVQFYMYPAFSFYFKICRRIKRLGSHLIYEDNLPDIITANRFFEYRCVQKNIETNNLNISLSSEIKRKKSLKQRKDLHGLF